MERKRILAIDDCRELSFAHVLARTFRDGINALKFLGPWDELYLDHDLCAIDHQSDENGKELTGYHILCFLEENPEYLPKRITLVTSNPSGRIRMEQLIKRLYKEG